MNPAPSYLQNTKAVVDAFGYWPSFHDAPVLDFRYATEDAGVVEFTLHAWVMTPEVDERGYFKLIKHHLVHIAFQGISNADLERFTSMGNILFELGFSTPEEFKSSGEFRVVLDSAMGGDLCGSFSASAGQVLKVTPCDAKGKSTEHPAAPNTGIATRLAIAHHFPGVGEPGRSTANYRE